MSAIWNETYLLSIESVTKNVTVTAEIPGKNLWVIGLVFGILLILSTIAAILLRWFGGDGLGAAPYASILFKEKKRELEERKRREKEENAAIQIASLKSAKITSSIVNGEKKLAKDQ